MLIPANFAIGALVGAAASYVYKDDAAKQALSNLSSKVKGGLDSTLAMLKPQQPETDSESAIADAEGVEEAEVVAEEKSDKA